MVGLPPEFKSKNLLRLIPLAEIFCFFNSSSEFGELLNLYWEKVLVDSSDPVIGIFNFSDSCVSENFCRKGISAFLCTVFKKSDGLILP